VPKDVRAIHTLSSHKKKTAMAKHKSVTFSLAKVLVVLISYLPALQSRPTDGIGLLVNVADDDGGFPEEDPRTPAFWWKLGISLVLVLLGGVFAGLEPILMRALFADFRFDVGVVESGRDYCKQRGYSKSANF